MSFIFQVQNSNVRGLQNKGIFYYYSHFKEEELGVGDLGELLGITGLVSIRMSLRSNQDHNS